MDLESLAALWRAEAAATLDDRTAAALVRCAQDLERLLHPPPARGVSA